MGSGGLELLSVTGNLSFTDLDIYATGAVGGLVVTSSGTYNAAGAGFRIAVAPGLSTFAVNGGPGIHISDASTDVQIDSYLSTNSAARGLSLVNTLGSLALPVGEIMGSAGTGVFIQGGNSNITLGISVTVTQGKGIDITSRSGGTIASTGPLSLSTGANTAFSASGGGTVTVVGSGNTITSTTGTALNFSNTTIGAGGLNFQSITSNGGSATGIILDNTGTTAGLTITGTGTAGSGGTIANKTGTDGQAATGIGIYLNNTKNPSFARMQLNDFQNFAIRGFNVNGLTISNCIVNGNNGTNADINEGAVYFGKAREINGVTGSASITGSTFSGGLEDNFHVFNLSGVLDRITFTSCTFGHNSTLLGSDALFLQADQTATLKATVDNCTFQGSRGDIFQFDLGSTAVGDLVFNGNTSHNTHPNIVPAGGGLTLSSGGTNYNPTFTYSLTNNIFSGCIGTAIAISKGGIGAGHFTGTISGNTIGKTWCI